MIDSHLKIISLYRREILLFDVKNSKMKNGS